MACSGIGPALTGQDLALLEEHLILPCERPNAGGGERLADTRVAAACEGLVVLVPVHRRRFGGACDLDQDFGGVATQNDEPRPTFGERGGKGFETAEQEADPRGAGVAPAEEGVVQDEDRNEPFRCRGGPRQRGIVAKTEITPEPMDADGGVHG